MSRRTLGNALLGVGAILLLLAVGTVTYAQWAEWQYRRQQPPGPQEPLPERLTVLDTAADAGDSPAAVSLVPAAGLQTATVGDEPSAAAGGLPATPPAAAPGPESEEPGAPALAEDGAAAPPEAVADESEEEGSDSAAPGPTYGDPVWITIPRIRVDSKVLPVGVQNGEYQVPSWEVGYHADSAKPGLPGNSVFNGHLETINAGRVFARLKELRVGDAVYVYTPSHRLDWVVREVRTVPNTDYSFIQPTADTRITLYTCAGRYDPRIRGYTHWLVVVGQLVSVTPRG
ncbi:MAG TPA: class F sortase [Chloroflexota bacterium]|nr:class F sortase [Chloroflexota bacterium]